jgi:hypothetical protein
MLKVFVFILLLLFIVSFVLSIYAAIDRNKPLAYLMLLAMVVTGLIAGMLT